MTPASRRDRLRLAVLDAQNEWFGKACVWGRDDCACAAADVLAPVLGYDPVARWRGRYTTPRGYLRVLKRDGLNSLGDAIAVVARERGWPGVDPGEARPGDVGVIAGQTIALAIGNGFWIARREGGFAVLDTRLIDKAWSVLIDAPDRRISGIAPPPAT